MKNKNKFNQGQSLFEIIIALTIVSLVAIGLVKASSFSVKNVRFSVDQNKLTSLAKKRIAQIIDQKNTDPVSFWNGTQYFPKQNFPCLTGSFCTEENIDEGYCLTIAVSDTSAQIPTGTPNYLSAKMATIEVNVFWEQGADGKDCGENSYRHRLNFKTNVTNH